MCNALLERKIFRFSSAVDPSYDGFSDLSTIDILGLRQKSYASGIMPSGEFCPEGITNYKITDIWIDISCCR